MASQYSQRAAPAEAGAAQWVFRSRYLLLEKSLLKGCDLLVD